MRRTAGLVGSAARTAGRTAIIAGTAKAVLGRGQSAPPQAAPQQTAPPVAPTPAPVEAAPAPAGDDVVAKLQQLAGLKAAGILSDEEFAAAKKKLLA